MNRTLVVRAAIAASIGSGLGREPPGEAWCSETAMLTQPSRSAHSAMSRAAAYRSPHVVPAKDGLRKSNRSPKSKLTRAMLSGRGAESAEGAVVGADVDVAPRRALE